MRKVLILGTNAGQADIIRYLKQNQWEVHACGHKKKGLGCEIAHYFHLVDTIDTEAVKQLATKINADLVYSVSSDSAIKTATIVSESLGLPYLLNSELIQLFDDKNKLRDYLNEKNISPVRYLRVKSLQDINMWDTFPAVVKPADAQGQRGVKLVKTYGELENAIKKALQYSISDSAIIEEYLEGTEVSTNLIIQHGEVVINEFTERLVFENEHFGLPKGHSIPVRSVTHEEIEKARKLAETFVHSLGIYDAVFYIQMKMTQSGARIIEVAPRLDGCHIWRLLKLAKGYDLRAMVVQLLLKQKIEDIPKQGNHDEKMTLMFHHLPTGESFSTDHLAKPDKALFNEFRFRESERIESINGVLEVVGYCITKE